MPFVLISLGLIFFFFLLFIMHILIWLLIYQCFYWLTLALFISTFVPSTFHLYYFSVSFFCFDVLFHSICVFLNFVYHTEQMLSEMFLSALVSVFYVNKYFISFLIFFLNPPEHRVVYKPLQLNSLWVDSPYSVAVFMIPIRIMLSHEIRALLYMIPSKFLVLWSFFI